MVEFFAALRRPAQQLDGAVDGDALLVAGDEERQRAALRLAAVRGQMIERRRDEAGDAAFHVDGAAAVDLLARHLAGKRRMAPGCFIARRHHVGVAGKHEIGPFAADPGVKVLDRRGAGLGEGGAVNGKSRLPEHRLQIADRPAFLRRDRAAADEIAGDGDGIGGHARWLQVRLF